MNPAKNSELRIVGGVVVKRYRRDVDLEYEKAVALWELSQAHDFLAPRPLDVRRSENLITYAFIPELTSIRVPYLAYLRARSPGTALLTPFRRAGETLAVIHAGLRLRSCRPWRPSRGFESAARAACGDGYARLSDLDQEVVLHGDYGFSNIGYVESSPGFTPVVTDASANNFTTFHSNERGSPYLDLAHFVSCLDGLVPLAHYPYCHWGRLAEVRETFLSAYERTRGVVLDKHLVSALAYATTHTYFSKRFPLSAIGRLALAWVYNPVKGNATWSGRIRPSA